ncbi:MAG: hypothetical protein U5L45_09400 [Saprospiraceae bacterium]|nr:hypothetical protein [Saprospiraceae bacterium]
MVRFFGQSSKNEPPLLFCERSLFTSRIPSGELWAKYLQKCFNCPILNV